ncbi:helix-hairpin-helix domain-containing protein [bacterium]|nr:helix-hairpin-helix domain-containing protein [bacterium]
MRQVSILLLILLLFTGLTSAADYDQDIVLDPISEKIRQADPFEGLVDLNNTDFDAVMSLPISEELAMNIWKYREFHSYFDSFYDLMKVEGMDVASFLSLKSVVYIKAHKEENYTTQRLQSLYYILANQSDEEGIQEGVTDEWTDFLLTPFNINIGNYAMFLNFPNVSPVDAYSISMKLKDTGSISSMRSLRNTQGLSSYGYRNLRNFVTYSDNEYDERLHFFGQVYFDTSPYLDDEKEMLAAVIEKYDTESADHIQDAAFLRNYLETKPALMTKLRLRKSLPKFGKEIKLGGLMSRAYGDDFDITKNSKIFLEYRLDDKNKIVFGDFRLAFGHGLIMENSDFYSPRKTGFGFSKRITGLIGDTSRTDEFKMRGVAAEMNLGPISTVLFYSDDKKDALLNADGSVFSYIVNKPALSNEHLETLNEIANEIANGASFEDIDPANIEEYIFPSVDVLHEKNVGGHLRFNLYEGNYVAFTGYHAMYDRHFERVEDAEEFGQYIDPEEDDYAEKLLPLANNEIFYMYDSQGEKSRTVMGGELGLNIANISFLGEYGKLINGGDAVVMSLFTQYNSFYILALYRDIDVDFDNPYSRPFAENPKFNDTFFEKASYKFLNPFFGNVFYQSPGSQPEQGFYLETRFQLSRNLTISRAYIDLWRRKADNRPSLRFQGDLEYRPIFALRINFKQKFLWNKLDNSDARSVSNSSETTIRIRGRLSQYDQLGFEYMYTYTNLPPYPYLSNPAEANIDNMVVGSEKLFGHLYTVTYSRHFTKTFDLRMDITFWDSPSSSMWDWEDTNIDFMSGRGYKFWFVLTDWLSPNVNVKFKFWYKKFAETEHYVRAWWNDELVADPALELYPYLSSVRSSETALKVYLNILY